MREWHWRDRRVRGQQQRGDGLADELGAADHDGARALELDARVLEQHHHPGRRARHQPGPALGEQPRAERREAVDVLRRADQARHLVGVEVIRQRQLEQDAAHLRVRR